MNYKHKPIEIQLSQILSTITETYNSRRKDLWRIELAYLTQKNGRILYHVVYKFHQNGYTEESIKGDYTKFLHDSLKDEDYSFNFNIRFYLYNVFQQYLMEYLDPDIMSGLSNSIGIVAGEHLFEKYKQFIADNIPAGPAKLLNPYWGNVLQSNQILTSQVATLEIQLQRTLLNYLKLIYALKYGIQDFESLNKLIVSEEYRKIIHKDLDFIQEDEGFTKEKIEKAFFVDNSTFDEKLTLLKTLFAHLSEWLLSQLKNNSENYGVDLITEWLQISGMYIREEEVSRFTKSAHKILTVLYYKDGITEQEKDLIEKTANQLGIKLK